VDFLHEIPGGLDGVVGERGANISGGQRQRLGLARAFLKDSPLLILDEPTSALDSQSERLIIQSIGELMQNKTVLLVTHNMKLLGDFERILKIEEGNLQDATHTMQF
jgi:subfamily B ATP-binding cassette protein MsbA